MPPGGRPAIEVKVKQLKDDWDKLSRDMNTSSNRLQGALTKWNDYEECHGGLVKWLAETENSLQETVEPKTELVEKKAQLERYRTLREDVDEHEKFLDQLGALVADLEEISGNKDVRGSYQDVEDRFQKLQLKIQVQLYNF